MISNEHAGTPFIFRGVVLFITSLLYLNLHNALLEKELLKCLSSHLDAITR